MRSREVSVRLITTAELARAGCSPTVIRTLVKRGELVRVAPGFYASAAVAAKALSLQDGQRAWPSLPRSPGIDRRLPPAMRRRPGSMASTCWAGRPRR